MLHELNLLKMYSDSICDVHFQAEGEEEDEEKDKVVCLIVIS